MYFLIYCMYSVRIWNIAGATQGTFLCQYWLNEKKGGFFLAHFQIAEFAPCSSNIVKAPIAAVYAYPKCSGNCSMLIQNVKGVAVFM
jgi:hypothetical protein